MSAISFTTSLSYDACVKVVQAIGQDVTVIITGEPGIGKSSLLGSLAKLMPGYETAYIDCTLLDLGDFALPYVETVPTPNGPKKITDFAPNGRFKFHTGKPVIIMLDEIGKASKGVKNVLLTLMLEKRIGTDYLPKGSIVIGTTNKMTDGLGDFLEAHARNRVCLIDMAKPTSEQWVAWGSENDIAPEVLAWVSEYPQSMATYMDPAQQHNEYIFNPRRAAAGAFVTPRSLHKASFIVKARDKMPEDAMLAALAGTVGESAARDMQAFISAVDRLPTWRAIVDNPMTAKLPEDATALCIVVFSAMQKFDRETLPAWMTYAKRLDTKYQALFATSAMASSRQNICISSAEFKKWAIDNSWLF